MVGGIAGVILSTIALVFAIKSYRVSLRSATAAENAAEAGLRSASAAEDAAASGRRAAEAAATSTALEVARRQEEELTRSEADLQLGAYRRGYDPYVHFWLENTGQHVARDVELRWEQRGRGDYPKTYAAFPQTTELRPGASSGHLVLQIAGRKPAKQLEFAFEWTDGRGRQQTTFTWREADMR
ncbi:hypothetical protein ACWERI_34160 [Streptomyces collinus]